MIKKMKLSKITNTIIILILLVQTLFGAGFITLDPLDVDGDKYLNNPRKSIIMYTIENPGWSFLLFGFLFGRGGIPYGGTEGGSGIGEG